MDYILGGNPLGLSLMVGYGTKYPQFLHHRGASIASFAADPTKVACQEGVKKWYQSPRPNPNVHNGAIVGGPDVVSTCSHYRHYELSLWAVTISCHHYLALCATPTR